MKQFSPRLSPFARRVRLVRSWRGLAMGASFGAAVSAAWAVLDWMGTLYTDWKSMAIVTGLGALTGVVVGFAWPIAEDVLTRSVDRRGNLEDRLTTAAERSHADLTGAGAFDSALREDAEVQLAGVRPKSIYPIRVGRWQGGAVALCALAAAIFLLGNSPILLNDDAKRSREALKKQGEKVERVTRENFETPEAQRDMSEAEKKLADELKQYQRDLEKARMSDEQAIERANEIAKKADDLMRQTAKNSSETLDSAQHALEQMEKDELAKAGMQDFDPAMAQMSDSELSKQTEDAQSQLEKAQSQSNGLQSQLDALMQKLNDPKLSPQERKALEAQKKALEKKLSDAKNTISKAQKDLAALKMSKDAQDLMRRLLKNPLFKQIQELAAKLRKNADAVKNGDRPQITDEQRAEMQRKFDALVAQLKDQKALDEYLKKLLEAMKQAKKMGQCNGVCLCLGLSRLVPMPGTGAPGNSVMLSDIGKVNHSDKALPSEGKTQATQITGMSRPTGEETPYVEIKAPTTVGNRSAVPYVKVLPSYRKKAESALDRQEIPKEDEKRVRAYFESLGH